MTEIPCTITRDVPEAGVKAGQKGLVYATEGDWSFVELQSRAKTVDFVQIPTNLLTVDSANVS